MSLPGASLAQQGADLLQPRLLPMRRQDVCFSSRDTYIYIYIYIHIYIYIYISPVPTGPTAFLTDHV